MTPEQAAVIESAKKWADAKRNANTTTADRIWRKLDDAVFELLSAVAALRQAERQGEGSEGKG